MMMAVLVIPSMLFAQVEQVRTVTVHGTSSAQVMPDRISWVLSVMVRDEERAKLSQQADIILSEVLAAAARLGLQDDEVRIGRVSINMQYKTKDRDESDHFSHYELTQIITLIQSDVDNHDDYWRELTSIEGLRVRQEFMASSLDATSRRLRIEALQSAHQKAMDMAEVVGATVGRVVSISEFKPNPTQRDIDEVAMQAGVVRGSLKPEGITVTAKIYAVFELE